MDGAVANSLMDTMNISVFAAMEDHSKCSIVPDTAGSGSSPSIKAAEELAAGKTHWVDSLGNKHALSNEQHAFLCQKAYEGEALLMANTRNPDINSDGNPWRFEFERKDLQLKVYNSMAHGNTIRRFKAVCVIPGIAPRELMAFIGDCPRRLTWDRNICALTTLQIRDDSRGLVTILRCATKQVGPISGRDFIDATIVRNLDDGSIVNGGSGLCPEDLHLLHPESKAFVRGLNQPGSGWLVEPIKSPDGAVTGSNIQYIIHTDLKGWFNAFIINQAIGGSYTAFFEDMLGALRERG